ncbi:ligand-binding sensor domain-containing protein, partial [Dysgonomonas sp. UBA7698]
MKKPLYTLLFFLFSFIIKAQQFEFSHLNNTNGLSNNQVEAILKDSRGFIWFGTNMGLNRYDGINFKTYKNIKNDSKSPSYDRFTGIQEDIKGNLWLQSSAGVYMLYDWKSESFINNIDSLLSDIGLPPAPAIIEIDKKKDLYISYPGKGIHKYDATTNKITIYKQSKNTNDLALSDISDIKIKDSYIWVLHNDGLLERVNMQTNRVDMRNTFFKDNNQNSTIQKSLFIDSDNDIWVYPSIADKGVIYLNTKKGQWTLLDTNSKVALSSSFVRCVGQDINGLIWIGTDHGGISILDKKNQKITVLKNDIYNHNSISQNSIISFYSEPNGTVWVGTYKSGASYYHPNLFKFRKSPLFYMFNKNAEIFDCNSLYKDKSNNLWIGTNGTGLIKYDQSTEKVERFRNNPNDAGSISSDIITSIYEDHTQTLWIGTFMGGLNSFDGKSFKKFQLNETNLNSLSSKSVYSLTEDNDHNL